MVIRRIVEFENKNITHIQTNIKMNYYPLIDSSQGLHNYEAYDIDILKVLTILLL